LMFAMAILSPYLALRDPAEISSEVKLRPGFRWHEPLGTDGEVHLHEYDIAFEAKAGTTVSHTFKADKTCSCDLEWESTSTRLGTLVVSP